MLIIPTNRSNWSYLEQEIIKHAHMKQKSFPYYVGTVFTRTNKVSNIEDVEMMDLFSLMLKYDLTYAIHEQIRGKSFKRKRYEYYINITFPDKKSKNCLAQNIYFSNTHSVVDKINFLLQAMYDSGNKSITIPLYNKTNISNGKNNEVLEKNWSLYNIIMDNAPDGLKIKEIKQNHNGIIGYALVISGW